MLAYLVLAVFCVPLTRSDSTEDREIKVSLDIKDPCWFHKSDDPVLVCTVNTVAYHIEWKNDDHVGAHGIPIGKDFSEYNITSYTNNSLRQEHLFISRLFATSLCINNQSEFHCENQGYSSPNFYLHIPACDACEDCSTVTGKEPPNNQIKLEVEDPYWFCKSEDPVLVCTVSSEKKSVLWRYNNDVIRRDGRPASISPTVNSNSTVRQKKLRVSSTVAISSVKEQIPFHCEIPGHSSPAVYPKFISDCRAEVTSGPNNGVASGLNNGNIASGPNDATVISELNSGNITSEPHDGKVTRLNGVNIGDVTGGVDNSNVISGSNNADVTSEFNSGSNCSSMTSGSENGDATCGSIGSISGGTTVSNKTYFIILGIAIGVLLMGTAMALYIYIYYRDRKTDTCRPTFGRTMDADRPTEHEHERMLRGEGTSSV